MKNTILAISMLLTSTIALAAPKIDLLKEDSLLCRTNANAPFILHEINSDKPKYNRASYSAVRINILEISKSEIKYDISSKDRVEAITFFKARENEEGVITLVGTLTTDMGDENLVECKKYNL